MERLARSDYEGYIDFITKRKEPQKLEEIPIACQFLNVFIDEVPS